MSPDFQEGFKEGYCEDLDKDNTEDPFGIC